MVIKRDGRREQFNRDKLWTSLTIACAKRPMPIGSVDRIIEDIESQLSNVGRAEIPSKVIGEMVMDRLKGLDRVAYVRFASVYRDFKDIESFKDEIEALLNPSEATITPSNQLSFLEDDGGITGGPQRRRRGRKPKKPQSDLA
jgi:transcriptional repressor NrdR